MKKKAEVSGSMNSNTEAFFERCIMLSVKRFYGHLFHSKSGKQCSNIFKCVVTEASHKLISVETIRRN